jgi:hypothetical protein
MVASGFVLRHPGLDIEIASPRSGECSPYVLAALASLSSPRRHGAGKSRFRQRTRSWNQRALRDARVTRYHMIAASTFVGIKDGSKLEGGVVSQKRRTGDETCYGSVARRPGWLN